MRIAAFIALFVAFPCPWYMFAVGGLLPLPVIARYGSEGGIILAVSAVHVAIYCAIFYFIVRRMKTTTSASALLAVSALSFLPIYGAGENLAAGGKLNRNAWQAYAEAFR